MDYIYANMAQSINFAIVN